MTVRQGSQVQLQVRVTGIPTPVVKFYRDGAEIQSSLDFQISQEGNLYSLLIAEAYPEDSGTYSVNATNSVGRATSTAELLVQGRWERLRRRRVRWKPVGPGICLPPPDCSPGDANHGELRSKLPFYSLPPPPTPSSPCYPGQSSRQEFSVEVHCSSLPRMRTRAQIN